MRTEIFIINFSDQQFNQLYRYAMALNGNEEQAWDLLQSAVEKALKSPGEIKNPMAFVRASIKNLYIDNFRREQNFTHIEFDESNIEQVIYINSDTMEDIVISHDEFCFYWNLMSMEERELLFYSAIEGYTADEIAQVLKSNRGTVLSKIHRVKNRIREAVSGQANS